MRLSILSALAAAALLAACSSDVPVNDAGGAGSGNTASTADTSGIAGQATPGSKGDFDQNVGNTVYFDLDSYSLSSDAQSQLQRQAAWLQQYPPFWFANLFDRMWVVLVSIIAVLLPLSRIVPPLYQFRIRSRVFRWYAQLRAIESSVGLRPADELARALDEVEERVGQVSVPLSYADELYALRSHIQAVRRRLQARPTAGPSSS